MKAIQKEPGATVLEQQPDSQAADLEAGYGIAYWVGLIS